MNDELIKMLKYLRLVAYLKTGDRYLGVGRKQNFSHVRLLEYIIEQEYKIKRKIPGDCGLPGPRSLKNTSWKPFHLKDNRNSIERRCCPCMTHLTICRRIKISSGSDPLGLEKQALQPPF